MNVDVVEEGGLVGTPGFRVIESITCRCHVTSLFNPPLSHSFVTNLYFGRSLKFILVNNFLKGFGATMKPIQEPESTAAKYGVRRSSCKCSPE